MSYILLAFQSRLAGRACGQVTLESSCLCIMLVFLYVETLH
jgi:hypothetical protein